VTLSAAVEPAVEPAASRPGLRLTLILGALSAFGPLSMDMYLPGLPSLTRDLGASASTGQLTLTGCLLGLAGGQLLAGPLSDSLGRRRPLLAGLVGFIAASLACAAAPSIGILVALRFIQGSLGGAGVVIARAVVRDLFRGAAAARVFALLMLVTGVAPVFAPLVGGQLLSVTSWRGIFIVLGAIGVPLLVGTVLWLPETLPVESRRGGGLGPTLKTFRRLLSDRTFMPPAVSFSLAFAAMFAYIAGASFVLEDVFGVSPQVFSVVFAVNSVGLIAASQIGGRVVGRVGAPALLRFGVFGLAVGSIGVLAVTIAHAGLAPLLIGLFVILSSNGFVFPNATAAALADQEGALGSASALLGMGQFGIGALIAPIVGVAGAHDVLPMAIVIGVCGMSALAVNLVFGPRPGPRAAAPGTGGGHVESPKSLRVASGSGT
jgi:MFS transporter, DHA1 family, multidrug resistance protein